MILLEIIRITLWYQFALSGDRSYNKDNVRKYVVSGNSLIPGASTIHFDEISKERIFNAVDKMKGMKAFIKGKLYFFEE